MAIKPIKTFLCCCLLSVTATEVAANQTCTAITATGGPNYAPATWLENDEIIGYMPDLVRDIGQKLEIPTTVVQGGGWKRVLANVEAGQFDIVMGLLKNDERLTKFDYMAAVTEEPIVVASHVSNIAPYDGTWQSLTGLQGGVILGVSFGSKLNQFIKDSLNVRITPDYPGLFRQLNRGRLDYVIASEFALQVNASDANTLQSLHIFEQELSGEAIYMAFSKKSPCKHLVDAFSAHIKSMRTTGEIASLIEKYKVLRLK